MRKARFLSKIFIVMFLCLFITAPAFAQNLSNAFGKPLNDAAGAQGAGYIATDDPGAIVGKVIQAALGFVGVIFFILMIYGGYIWMMARGNDQDVDRAKNLITAAIIGLTIVLSAYAISYFILSEIGKETLIQ